MPSGYEALAAIQAQIRGLGKGFAEEVAREAAPLVEAAMRANAAKGVDPGGKAWAPKKDGSAALKNAPAKISAQSLGTVVQIVLEGNEVYSHNFKGLNRRKVIPTSGDDIPPYIIEAIKTAANRVWARRTGSR